MPLVVTIGRTPGATTGGTVVTSYNHSTGAVENSGLASIQLPDLTTWVPFELSWSVSGEQTSQAVTLPVTTDVEWSATGSGTGSTTLNAGVIGNAAVRVWARAKATRATGNLTQRVSNIVYGYGADAPSYPIFNTGPTVSGVSSSAATVTATFSDPDVGGTVTAKLIVRTVNSAPTTGEWAGSGASGTIVYRAAFTSGSYQVTGLSNSTDYYAWVQLTDNTGLVTTSSVSTFTTGSVANVAPTISSLTTASETSQGFTLSGTISDPEGDTITSKRYIVCNTNSTPTQGEIDGSAGGRVMAVGNYTTAVTITGLTQTTTYYWWLYATDASHPNLAGGATLTSAQTATTATLTLSGTLSLTSGGTTSLSADWPDATGGADGYDLEYGTTTGYGSAVSPDPSTSTGSITGLTEGTLYYVRVRAHDSAGNLTSYLTASLYTDWLNDFSAAESLDTGFLTTAVSGGSATVTSNQLKLLGTQDSHAAIVYHNDKLDLARHRLYSHKVRLQSMPDGSSNPLISMYRNSSAPAVAAAGTFNTYFKNACTIGRSGTAYLIKFINHKSTVEFWNFTTGAWGTADASYTAAVQTDYIVQIEHTTTQFRFLLRDTNGTLVTNGTTGWINFSDITGSGSDWWIWAGDQYTDYYYCDMRFASIRRVDI